MHNAAAKKTLNIISSINKLFFTHLTLVRAVVSFLHVFYFQCPIIRALGMQHGEPLVVCVREHARSQYVPVPAANP